ncbi:CheW protein [Aromatoleum tolulyticum]|uniref:CheW protein n=1 Tax=Aromatoleum tolulyticum TaxID=34027 RepID=A0A1N6N459_9RHOO|nr:chemotaxis protein CheW [Aromatoleum tolulyticum]SIP86870.1 CheW protein [Aromatoleum tolulyticum]
MTRPAGRGGAAIDWSEIRRRMADAERALEEQFVPAPGQRRAILEARARALAAGAPAEPGASIEVLEFTLANERYAIESSWVSEVVPLRELTPLPGTPAFVLGIIHLRGEVISVLDLKKFFELPDRGLSDLDKAIVLDDGAMQFAILADAIVGVRRLLLDDVQPPLPTLTDVRADYLLGITRQSEVVLDGRKLLADPAIVVADETGG